MRSQSFPCYRERPEDERVRRTRSSRSRRKPHRGIGVRVSAHIYPRLSSDRLKESVYRDGQCESAGSAWLIERARDNAEPLKLRKSALFWAGQRKSTPTKDLVAYYSATARAHAARARDLRAVAAGR